MVKKDMFVKTMSFSSLTCVLTIKQNKTTFVKLKKPMIHEKFTCNRWKFSE